MNIEKKDFSLSKRTNRYTFLKLYLPLCIGIGFVEKFKMDQWLAWPLLIFGILLIKQRMNDIGYTKPKHFLLFLIPIILVVILFFKESKVDME